MKTLVSGTQSVSDGAAQLNTGVGTLIGTLNKMGTDLAETKASIGEISEDTANNAGSAVCITAERINTGYCC